MDTPQIFVFSIIFLALVLFSWGKIRHDLVAVICLLLLNLTGIITPEETFAGFAHPAVITVAVILIVSAGLKNSGFVDYLGKSIERLGDNLILQMGVLCTAVCFSSAFMNNVGALAVFMPIAIHLAVKNNRSPSIFLMPIAFSSLIGGMTTLIGTPPNIIISSFRNDSLGEPFAMFDFLPVGIGIVVASLAYIVFISWRILPDRVAKSSGHRRFNIDEYITEVMIVTKAKIIDLSLYELRKKIQSDVQILNIIRNNQLLHAPRASFKLNEGDILTIETDSENLKAFLDETNVELVGKGIDKEKEEEAAESPAPKRESFENITNVEVVVMSDSILNRKTASQLKMRSRFGINLLAISRQGTQIQRRIDHIKFQVGDVLLLQGNSDQIDDILETIGCLPLADRGFTIGKPRKIILALAIFLLAIGLVISGIVAIETSFIIAATLMVLTKVLPIQGIYQHVDWPVIILLGAMLPLGFALEKTGGAQLIADLVVTKGSNFPVWVTLAILFIITQFLSDIINNAATVVLMAPIAITIATAYDVSIDPFLMCIAVASSSSFLTPIGHQSNTLVMGPGGYKFTDYTKVGFPLTIIILLVAIPLILYFWPL